MIEPLQSDDLLLADIEAAPDLKGCLSIWWLGQSGFLLRWGDRRLLLDPYLSDSLTRKYAGTDKPHVRMTRRVVDPGRLHGIGVVTSSHAHTDHLDPETLQPLFRASAGLSLVAPESQRGISAERAGILEDRVLGMDAGDQLDVGGFQVTAVPAAHETLERDGAGRHKFLGFVVKLGKWTVYHSGDTVRYDGMVEVLRPFQVDVALLPINGALPERRVAGNLDGPEAARVAKEIGARLVIPCHFEMFQFNTASPAPFVAECERLGQTFRVLRAGERVTLSR